MSTTHIAIIQLAIAYTLFGVFIFTVVATCLSLVGFVKFAEKSQQKKLFAVLIVEVVVVGVGYFSDLLRFNPSRTAEETRQTAARVAGTVYIHIPTESKRSDAERLQKVAARDGYLAPAVEFVGESAAPSANEIRYFYREQRERAEHLGVLAAQEGIGSFSVRFLSGFQGKAPSTLIEVWFAVSK